MKMKAEVEQNRCIFGSILSKIWGHCGQRFGSSFLEFFMSLRSTFWVDFLENIRSLRSTFWIVFLQIFDVTAVNVLGRLFSKSSGHCGQRFVSIFSKEPGHCGQHFVSIVLENFEVTAVNVLCRFLSNNLRSLRLTFRVDFNPKVSGHSEAALKTQILRSKSFARAQRRVLFWV